MDARERTLRTFERKSIDRIVWQPRIYYWYNGRREMGNMPEAYKGKSMLDIYDDLGASPRYAAEVLGISVFSTETDNSVHHCAREEGENTITVHETPKGALREVVRKGTQGSGGYHTEYPVKTTEDMKIMRYILEHTRFAFDGEAFERAERTFGSRGIVQTYYPRSPFQRLVINYMGFDNTIYALKDHQSETEDFMKAIETSDDQMYDVILDSPFRILNFGENIDANIDSPRLFEKYLVPYYKKRVNQIHQSGKFCHIHMDGSLKALLPLINEAGFDGIEAATPLPQGDVTLEELKDALGDTILLDGIPAILFLPQYSYDEIADFAIKLLEMFTPNLILGVSDELPPPGDIGKVKLLSQLVKDYQVQKRSRGDSKS